MLTPVLSIEARAIVVTFDGTEVMRWTAPDDVEDVAAWADQRVEGLTWAPNGAPRAFVYNATLRAFALAEE